jgi:hypothetical protein
MRSCFARRIEGLEERLEPRDELFAFEDAISREVISRMSTEELREYRDISERCTKMKRRGRRVRRLLRRAPKEVHGKKNRTNRSTQGTRRAGSPEKRLRSRDRRRFSAPD